MLRCVYLRWTDDYMARVDDGEPVIAACPLAACLAAIRAARNHPE